MPMFQTLNQKLRHWLQVLQPPPTAVSHTERLRIAVGAAFGIALAAGLSQWLAGDSVGHFWHSASLGASAMLIFSMPSTPLAQPWAVIAGNAISVAIGMACVHSIPNVTLAIIVALPLSIWAMMLLRAIHPPGAGLALYVVLHQLQDPALLLFPFLFNFVLLVLAAVVFHRLTGRKYPHPQVITATSAQNDAAPSADHITTADLDNALARYNEVLAISREDLANLLQEVNGAAFQRHLGSLQCQDIMTREVHSIHSEAALEEAWQTLRNAPNRLLPVVDANGHFLGMIGINQWLDAIERAREEEKARKAAEVAVSAAAASAIATAHPAPAPSWASKFKRWLSASAAQNTQDAVEPQAQTPPPVHQKYASEGPVVVRDAMIPSLAIAHPEQPIMEIVPLLCQGGLYLVPVTNEEAQLVGIISQTDLLRALNAAIPD